MDGGLFLPKKKFRPANVLHQTKYGNGIQIKPHETKQAKKQVIAEFVAYHSGGHTRHGIRDWQQSANDNQKAAPFADVLQMFFHFPFHIGIYARNVEYPFSYKIGNDTANV